MFADNPSYYEKVIRAQEFVRQVVPYDLNAPAPGETRDIVDYFLFEAESGFCTYYASAMAVILHIEGIPTRVVTGYAPGVYVVEEGYFEVTGDLAHAWVEVYFPEYGWIPFEPTPSQAVPGYSLEEEIIEEPVIEEIETLESKVVLLIQQILLGVVVSAAILVSGVIIVRFIKRRIREKHLKLHPVELIYQRMRMNLEKAGFTATPAMTPREFMEEARRELNEYPKLRGALVQGTYLFEVAFYGFRQIEDQETHRLRFRYRDAYWEQIKLRYKFLESRIKFEIIGLLTVKKS